VFFLEGEAKEDLMSMILRKLASFLEDFKGIEMCREHEKELALKSEQSA
jgi:hypothetical protein